MPQKKKNAANSTASTLPTRRSTRNRGNVEPKLSEDELALENGVAAQGEPMDTQVEPMDIQVRTEAVTPKQPKIILKQSPVASRPSKSKYDNPDEMMSNPRAPLAHTKLRELLCSPMAWDLLDAAEKKQVLAQFPDDQDIVDPNTESACPNVKALRNNNNFRHDVARYQDNLREGRHDPDWIAEARSAHEKRKLGLYDDYIANKFETDWEVALPGHDKVE